MNNELFNQKDFPEWKGYGKITEKQIENIKKLWLNNIDLMAESIYRESLKSQYFNDMLLYIQRKLYLDEPLNLCLNSANEVFDIVITPCEILNDKGKELPLDDYDEIEEWTIEQAD